MWRVTHVLCLATHASFYVPPPQCFFFSHHHTRFSCSFYLSCCPLAWRYHTHSQKIKENKGRVVRDRWKWMRDTRHDWRRAQNLNLAAKCTSARIIYRLFKRCNRLSFPFIPLLTLIFGLMLWCFYAVTLGNAQAGGGGVNILCNMLIDSTAPFRWVIFFSFFLHYQLQKHTHTQISPPSWGKSDLRPALLPLDSWNMNGFN